MKVCLFGENEVLLLGVEQVLTELNAPCFSAGPCTEHWDLLKDMDVSLLILEARQLNQEFENNWKLVKNYTQIPVVILGQSNLKETCLNIKNEILLPLSPQVLLKELRACLDSNHGGNIE